MNTARIVVLTAVVAPGGITAYPASGSDSGKPTPAETVAQPIHDQKRVKTEGCGLMAAILPGGTHIISTAISMRHPT